MVYPAALLKNFISIDVNRFACISQGSKFLFHIYEKGGAAHYIIITIYDIY